MEIVRKELTADELQPANLRYNETTDAVQITNDDGATWIDAPALDPRRQYQQPPVDTSDPRCDGSARMTAEIQSLISAGITNVDNAGNIASGASLLFSGISLIAGVSMLSAIMASAASAFLDLGALVLHDEFDAFDWDAMTCAFYCVVNDEGRLSEEAMANFTQDYVNTLTLTQSALININMLLLGWGGLSDYAALRTETGDCVACDACETCWTFIDLGTNTIAGNFTVSTYSAATLTPAVPLRKIRIDWHFRPNAGATYQEGYFALLVPGGAAPLVPILAADTPDGFYEEEFDPPQNLGSLYAQIRSWYVGGSNYPDLTLTLWYSPSWSGSWAQGQEC